MRRVDKRLLWLAGMVSIALVAAACGGDGASGSAGGGDSLSLNFSSPADAANVSDPFTVTFDASVALDDPSTGEHHVHLCIDGADCDAESEYALVYGDTFEVSGLSTGEHTIEASLRNADHTDAGPSDEITIVVGDGAGTQSGGGSDSGESDSSGDIGGGFDY
jgi:hypothetical protein